MGVNDEITNIYKTKVPKRLIPEDVTSAVLGDRIVDHGIDYFGNKKRKIIEEDTLAEDSDQSGKLPHLPDQYYSSKERKQYYIGFVAFKTGITIEKLWPILQAFDENYLETLANQPKEAQLNIIRQIMQAQHEQR